MNYPEEETIARIIYVHYSYIRTHTSVYIYNIIGISILCTYIYKLYTCRLYRKGPPRQYTYMFATLMLWGGGVYACAIVVFFDKRPRFYIGLFRPRGMSPIFQKLSNIFFDRVKRFLGFYFLLKTTKPFRYLLILFYVNDTPLQYYVFLATRYYGYMSVL